MWMLDNECLTRIIELRRPRSLLGSQLVVRLTNRIDEGGDNGAIGELR